MSSHDTREGGLALAAATKPGTKQPVVSTLGLTKNYGQLCVLDNIDFDISEGEIVAIIGPSGSGKSTFLRCINHLEEPTSGKVTVDGRSIESSGKATAAQLKHLQRSLGMVFQNFNLFPHMTVMENISLGQRRALKRDKAAANERTLELLARVGLADKAQVYPSQCSGGQQQRIAICRALALEPRVMLFDEPTSALDPELGVEVLNVMRELASQGMTMIVVTHEMQFAESVANRVVVMADGRVIEEGDAKGVIRNPQTERAKQFLHAVRDR